jgi:hypothetical protein
MRGGALPKIQAAHQRKGESSDRCRPKLLG